MTSCRWRSKSAVVWTAFRWPSNWRPAQVGSLGLRRSAGATARQFSPAHPAWSFNAGAPSNPSRHAGLELRTAQPVRTDLPAPTGDVPGWLHPGVGGGGDCRRTHRTPRGVWLDHATGGQIAAQRGSGRRRSVLPSARHHTQLCPGKTRPGRRCAGHPRTPCRTLPDPDASGADTTGSRSRPGCGSSAMPAAWKTFARRSTGA